MARNKRKADFVHSGRGKIARLSAPPSPTNLLDLPEEMLELQFSYLDLPSALGLASSCSRLQGVLSRPRVWRGLLRRTSNLTEDTVRRAAAFLETSAEPETLRQELVSYLDLPSALSIASSGSRLHAILSQPRVWSSLLGRTDGLTKETMGLAIAFLATTAESETLLLQLLEAAQVKTESGTWDQCVLCGESVRRTFGDGTSDLRFHYFNYHYFPAGSFSDFARADLADMVPGRVLCGDLMGRVYKYKCPLQPCIQRSLGYKELAHHMATQHRKLREVMAQDPRPGVAGALALLYPEDQPDGPAPGQV